MRATPTLKTCRAIIFSARLSLPNDPAPRAADQIATPEATSAAGAAPRRRKRQAAAMIKGKTRYSRRSRFWKRT